MNDEKKSTVKEWIYTILLAFLITFVIRSFIVEPYMVSGPSMFPTLENRERVLVNKFGYLVGEPKRNEIVIFKYPMDESRDFIKRVVAIGGDTLEIVDGKTFVNGKKLNENYIKEPFYTNYDKVVIPKGYIFVMGDNRNNSEDSRYSDVGFVPLNLVKGKASVIFWPIDNIKTLT